MIRPLYIKTTLFPLSLDGKEKPLEIGCSHWLGDPDLPKGYPYPTYFDKKLHDEVEMSFVGQINLADLPESCKALPHEGLLSFFAEISYYEGFSENPAIADFPSHSNAVKVLYFPTIKDFETQVLVDDDDYPLMPEALEMHLSEDPLPMGEYEHQLFGKSIHLETEDWPEPCTGWHLLLQMDSIDESDYNVTFMDGGVLCFLIDPQDLENLDFSKVRAIILST